MLQKERPVSTEFSFVKSQNINSSLFTPIISPKSMPNEVKCHRRFTNDHAIQIIKLQNDNRELQIKVMQKKEKIMQLKQELEDLKLTKIKQEEYYQAEINYLKKKKSKQYL